MGIFDRFKRKDSASIVGISKDTRALAEDMLDAGDSVADISAELNITPAQVKRLKDVMQQRKTRQRRRDAYDTVSSCEDKLDKANRDLQATKTELEIARIELEKEEIAIQRAELLGEDAEDEPDVQYQDGSIVEQALLGFVQGMNKAPPQPSPIQPPGATKSPQEVPSDPPPNERRLDDAQIRALLTTVPPGIKKRVMSGKIPKDAALAFIIGQGYTQADAERAYEMVMTK